MKTEAVTCVEYLWKTHKLLVGDSSYFWEGPGAGQGLPFRAYCLVVIRPVLPVQNK